MISTPTWTHTIRKFQDIFEKSPFHTKNKTRNLGWKINNKVPFQLQPIELHDGGDFTILELQSLYEYPESVQNPLDREIISLLYLNKVNHKKKQRTIASYQALQKLIGHDRVVVGKNHFINVKGRISLSLNPFMTKKI